MNRNIILTVIMLNRIHDLKKKINIKINFEFRLFLSQIFFVILEQVLINT
jgi:hypothetical protein